MKKIILALLCSFGLQQLSAQKLEIVHSVAKEWKEESWYMDQQKAWKKEIDKNKFNQEAWLNYYAATRALKVVTVANSGKYLEQCQQIVEEANKVIPKTFASYYLSYSEKGVGNGTEELLKAAAINDKDPRIIENLMIHYLLEGDEGKYRQYVTEMFKGNAIATSILNWAYNLLAELEPNAVLLTMGDSDSYATWIVQAVKNFRTDVTIVNTHLFSIDGYRNRLLKNWNYPSLDLQMATAKTKEEVEDMYQKIWKHLFNGSRPVYVISSGIRVFEDKWKDKLYLTGLAYRYSDTEIDNLSIIKRNYENRYLLDHLKHSFDYNIMNEMSDAFLATYLPSLIRLYEHYKLSEDKLNIEKYASLIKLVAEKSGRQEEVSTILK